MDEGKQPLSEAEQKQMQAEQEVQQAEAETGTTNVPRQLNDGQDPQVLDPRFDKDDLRQGKPPPAVRKRRHLRIRRKRKEKGKPLTKDEKAKAAQGTSQKVEGAEDEAEMTDEEVELTDDESSITGLGGDDDSNEKKPGLIGKILGKN